MGRIASDARSTPALFVAGLPAVARCPGATPGRLVDPGADRTRRTVPPGPRGEYPEDWAKCVADTNPTWPTLPPGIDPRGVDPALAQPAARAALLRRPHGARLHAVGEVEAGRRGPPRRALIWRLAREPRFRWFGRFTRPRMQKKVRGFLDRVQCDQPGAVPLMVVMRHQGMGCSAHYRAGGSAEDRRTMKWYDDFAAAVGDARVVIGFEPDSLGTVDCLARDRREDRLELLRYGVDVLSQLPNATIYLEAGASDWEPAARTAKQLRYIGISKVRGFMLNVTHHDWTRANIQHGLEISRMVGGKHFIINTSYNGRGPIHYRRWINTGRAQVAHDQRLVPPGPARPRPAADHGHAQPAGGRVHVHQPPRLLGRRLQRRPAAGGHLVAGARR